MKITFLFLVLTGFAFGKDITIHNVTRIPHQTRELTVKFESPAPEEQLVVNAAHWAARCFADEQTPPRPLNIGSAVHQSTRDFSLVPTVVLDFGEDVVTNCQTVEITLLAAKLPSARWVRKSAQNTDSDEPVSLWSLLFAAPDPDKDPDYSLSFTVVPAVGAKPLYSIDGSIHHRIVGNVPTELDLTATAKTDSSNKADLDSFTWGLPLIYQPAGSPKGAFGLTASLTGMEFDKSAKVMNEISGGSINFTHFAHKKDTHGHVIFSWGAQLQAGIEIGDNFKNEFTIANQPNQRGTGLIFRGVPNARFDFVVPTSNPKHAIIFNSSYTVRLPARDELFLETRHSQDPVPLVGTNPRHYLENNLTFKITDFFGFKFQHTYGALPPTFKFVDNKGSIGIVFQAMQP